MNVGLYVYDGYYETEICIATYLFKDKIVTLASDQNVITGIDGRKIFVDQLVKDTDPKEIDLLIIPGGKFQAKEDIFELIRQCEKNGAIVGGICAGVDYMVHAGVLSGRRYTSYYKQEETYEHLPEDGILTYTRYESDRNMVTANPNAYLEFALELYHLAGNEIESTEGLEGWFKRPLEWKK